MAGAQWLKLRDGNSSSSPLLASLPLSSTTAAYFSKEYLFNSPLRIMSSGRTLLLEFRSDVNITQATMVGTLWGFNMTAKPTGEFQTFYDVY